VFLHRDKRDKDGNVVLDNNGKPVEDVFKIDVDAILNENKRDQDMELKPGDLVYVDYNIFANGNASASAPQNATSSPANTPLTDKNAYARVVGEIRMRPELRIRFDPNHPITVSYAIIMAGWTGFSKHTVFLYRDEKDKDGKPVKDVFEIDVDAILNGSKPDRDMKLKQGDLIYVYSILPPFGKASGSVPQSAPSSPANTPLTLNISTGGTATISGLTVNASNIVKLGNGTINIESGTPASAGVLAINVATGATLTIAGNLGFSGDFIKTGGGNISFDGLNDLTGNVIVQQGFVTDAGNISSRIWFPGPAKTSFLRANPGAQGLDTNVFVAMNMASDTSSNKSASFSLPKGFAYLVEVGMDGVVTVARKDAANISLHLPENSTWTVAQLLATCGITDAPTTVSSMEPLSEIGLHENVPAPEGKTLMEILVKPGYIIEGPFKPEAGFFEDPTYSTPDSKQWGAPANGTSSVNQPGIGIHSIEDNVANATRVANGTWAWTSDLPTISDVGARNIAPDALATLTINGNMVWVPDTSTDQVKIDDGKVPVLGDLPLIGRLFHDQGNSAPANSTSTSPETPPASLPTNWVLVDGETLSFTISTGGTATISGLTVDPSNIAKLGNGTIDIVPGTPTPAADLTIYVSTGATLTISGNLGITGNIIKTGGGNLQSGVVSDFAGKVIVQQGSLTSDDAFDRLP
ncbi:MAG TPA: hypothetical protein VK737_12945, partial [Opitutales bacterium]|nr:hypothetical protein [Opitutales bacterium]